jgi:hypothetical protein
MPRNVPLSRGQVLWQQGEPALTLGVVKAGKLAVRTSVHVVGGLSRRMVLGEASLGLVEGRLGKRTHTVHALEDGTEVTEYPASLVKEMLDKGQGEVAALILRSLVGQICGNWTIVGAVHEDLEQLETPVRKLTIALLESLDSLEGIGSWAQFLPAFHMMLGLRDLSEAQRDQLVPSGPEHLDESLRASSTVRWLFKEKKASNYLDAFLAAEDERRALAERKD